MMVMERGGGCIMERGSETTDPLLPPPLDCRLGYEERDS